MNRKSNLLESEIEIFCNIIKVFIITKLFTYQFKNYKTGL